MSEKKEYYIQSLEEVLESEWTKIRHEACFTEGAIEDLLELLKEEPERKKGKWIPCSERLPEEHKWIGTKKFGTTISDEVYVTFETPKGERFCKHLSFQNGSLSVYDQQTIDVFYKGSKPIAWKPLPEPYGGVMRNEYA